MRNLGSINEIVRFDFEVACVYKAASQSYVLASHLGVVYGWV